MPRRCPKLAALFQVLGTNADLTPRIASGSQRSDQRPMVIGETIGWRIGDSEENIAPVVGWLLTDEAMAAAK